jgi:predicted nucleic acid-binding protein
MNYLVDTDILIDWLRGKKTVIRFFQETKGIFYYSSIILPEKSFYPLAIAQQKRKRF